MKVKCISDVHVDLKKGKIYNAEYEMFHGHKMIAVEDESGDGVFLYGKEHFEIIEE